MSKKSQVSKYLQKYPDKSCKQVQNHFCEWDAGYIKKLYYQEKKVTKKVTQKLPELPKSEKITMDNVEDYILGLFQTKPDISTLRVMVDFLKIKQQDQSELQDIDLQQFYKIAIENE